VFQILICLIFYSYSHEFAQNMDKYLTAVLIVSLLVPLVLYYIVFTLVISTWINVAHAMRKTAMVRKFKGCIKWSSVVIVVVYALIIVALLIFDHAESVRAIINIGELSWIAIMTVSIVGFSIYGARVVKLLYLTTTTVKSSKTKSAFIRITIAVVGLNLFFFIQCGLTVYFLLFPEKLTIHWRVGDLAIHALFLIILCYLYSEAFKNILVGEEKLGIGSSTKKGGSMRRQHSVQSRSGKSRDSDKEQSQVGSVSQPTMLGMARLNSLSSIDEAGFQNTPTPRVPAFLYGQSVGDGANTLGTETKVMDDLKRRVTLKASTPEAQHRNLASSSEIAGEDGAGITGHGADDGDGDDVIPPQQSGDTARDQQPEEEEEWEYYYEDDGNDDESVNM